VAAFAVTVLMLLMFLLMLLMLLGPIGMAVVVAIAHVVRTSIPGTIDG